MKLAPRIFLALALGAGLYAAAQSRTIIIRAVDVDVTGAEVALLPDAGCMLQPRFNVTIDGLQPQPAWRPFNGPRCANLMAAAEKAAFLDVRVSDGGTP